MRSSIPDLNLIREYLLGRLDDKQEIESDLSEKILLDDELCDTVDTVEDEIIDEYVDETLSPADRSAVDAYFLRPQERKEKLRFARLLQLYFETRRNLHRVSQGALSEVAYQNRPDARRTTHWFPRFSVYALAVLVLLGLVDSGYMRMHQKHLESELAQVQKRNASLMHEAQLSQSAMVLTLISPRNRGIDANPKLPQVDINSQTTRIRVEIALQAGQSQACDVRLETKGERGPIWSAKLLPNVLPSGDASLIFDVPTQGIESGGYSFVVSSGVSSSSYYDFDAQVAK